MGRPVVADEPGAVHREHDVQVLERDVVDDLVERALEEGRVDRGDRLHALERHAGGQQDRVLLGDADVVVAVGHRVWSRFRPVPEFIAAVMPQTRSSRLHSSISASPKTAVYCGGLGGSVPFDGFFGAGMRLAIDAGLAACHFSMPSSPPSSAGRSPCP